MTAPVSLKRSAAVTTMLAIALSLFTALPASALPIDSASFFWNNTEDPRIRVTGSWTGQRGRRYTFTPPAGQGDPVVVNRCNRNEGSSPETIDHLLPRSYVPGTWIVTVSHWTGNDICDGQPSATNTQNVATANVVQQAFVRETATIVPGSRVNYRSTLTAWGEHATGVNATVTFPAGTGEWQTCDTRVTNCSLNANWMAHSTSPTDPAVSLGQVDAAADSTRQLRVRVRVDSNLEDALGAASVAIAADNASVVAGALSASGAATTHSADLRLGLTKQNGNPSTWTATVSNRGPSDVAAAVLNYTSSTNETNPESFTYCIGSGCVPNEQFPVVGIPLGAMPNGDVQTVRISGPNGNTSLTLTVTPTAGDPIPGNNTATA